MIVIDTSALMAVLLDEDEAALFAEKLAASAPVIAAPTKLELLIVAHGRLGPNGVSHARALLHTQLIDVVEWTPALSDAAFQAFLLFGKGQHPAKLNFGDCMSYALAKSLNAPLLYKGEDFAKTGIKSAAAASV